MFLSILEKRVFQKNSPPTPQKRKKKKTKTDTDTETDSAKGSKMCVA